MMIAVALTSLLGGVIGIGSGVLIARSSKFARMAIRFLRLGLWLPFLASWVFWSSWIPAMAAVILASCYYYLSAKLTGGGLPQVIRSTVLQALLFLLVSQVWLGREYGWDWFMEGALGYSVLILAVFLFLLDRFFRSDFDQAAKERGAILVKQLGSRDSPPWGGAVLSGACIIPSLFFTGPIWKDIGISLLEMIGGLGFAGCVALIFVRGLSANVAAKRWPFMLLPLTYITPILLPLFLLHQSVLTLSWQTTAGVASLSFFPFVQTLWGLRDQPLRLQMLLAAEDALPFAFVAMLFGETMNAVAGLGFLMAVAHTLWESVPISMVALGLLIGLSFALDWGSSSKQNVGAWGRALVS